MLDQPSTPLGRVVVVLKNDPSNPGKWSIKRLVKDIQDHGWDAADTDKAVDQLLQWEILTKGHDGNYLKFHTTRVKAEDFSPSLAVS
jgi:hypothetical protein